VREYIRNFPMIHASVIGKFMPSLSATMSWHAGIAATQKNSPGQLVGNEQRRRFWTRFQILLD
jgi:hypothetical protein